MWCPSGSDDHCPDDQLCFAFSKCHAVDMNGMTLEQMEKQKNEYQNNLNNNQISGGANGEDDAWWEPGSGGSSSGGVVRTAAPTPADQVPGYYDQMLGGSKRPTRMPTKRPTNKPVMSAEQAMHRYSFCGAFWTDVSVSAKSRYMAFASRSHDAIMRTTKGQR